MLLGFLTGRPLPMVPDALRTAWGELDPRLRGIAVDITAERAVAARAGALHANYPPGVLTAVLSRVATGLLDGRAAPPRAGRAWVPPQLRWAHEADRAGWRCVSGGVAGIDLRGGPTARSMAAGYVGGWELAPPLDFALAGLPDWPGIRAADRLDLLLRHPLSFSRPRNRQSAAVAVFGAAGRAAFDADLAAMLPDAAYPVREASRLMDCPGDWLVTVLGWVILAREGEEASDAAKERGARREQHCRTDSIGGNGHDTFRAAPAPDTGPARDHRWWCRGDRIQAGRQG